MLGSAQAVQAIWKLKEINWYVSLTLHELQVMKVGMDNW